MALFEKLFSKRKVKPKELEEDKMETLKAHRQRFDGQSITDSSNEHLNEYRTLVNRYQRAGYDVSVAKSVLMREDCRRDKK